MVDIKENPFVGPRTFTRQEADRFFGREQEANDLRALVVSERLVLFYAQSGAGKSSLINTRLIPQLQQAGYAVLPVGRVSGELPESVEDVKNIFIFNLLLSLDQDNSAPDRFTQLNLADFLTHLTTTDGEHYYYDDRPEPHESDADYDEPRHALIIDQFEEILTTHLARWPDREDFFYQLNQAMLDDPLLWVVLTLREDYLAAIEPYAPLMRDKMRAHYYMQRMGYNAALAAVTQPAEQGGRPFAPGVAETLVDNLRQIRGQTTPSIAPTNDDELKQTNQINVGQFVEPVQLQVVCYQLWENLRHTDVDQITERDLQEAGDVDAALANFYEDALNQALTHSDISEIELRNWFDRQLITEAGTRGTVYQGVTDTAGLPNDVVRLLADQYLLRAELRAGGTWYELVHDRFVEPILKANQDWWLWQSPLVQAAQAWKEADEDKSKLYLGQQLRSALATIGARKPEPLVAEFLEASRAENQLLEEREAHRQRELEQAQALAEAQKRRAVEQTRATRRLRSLVIILVIIFLLALGAAIFAWTQSQRAQEQETIANEQAEAAQQAQTIAEANQAAAERAETLAKEQAQITLSRFLASQAADNLDSQLDLALLLAVESFQTLPTTDAKSSLYEVLLQSPNLAAFLREHTGRVWQVALSPDGKTVASAGEDGRILLWDITTNRLSDELPARGGTIYTIAFSPDGKILASGDISNRIILWNMETRQPMGDPLKHEKGSIFSVAFSPNGKILASGGSDGKVNLWDAETEQPLHPPLDAHRDWVWSVTFSPDGQTLVSGSRDKQVILWDVTTGQMLGRPLIGHIGSVATVAFSPNGQAVVSGESSGLILLWDVATQLQLLPGLREHRSTVWGLSFQPNNQSRQILASGSEDKTIILWDLITRQPLNRKLIGHGDGVYRIDFDPAGQLLASGSRDHTIILWQNIEDKLPQFANRLTHREDGTSRLAFSPSESQILAEGLNNGQIVLWDVKEQRQFGLLDELSDEVTGLAFSPDTPEGTGRKILASADADNIVLWNMATQEPFEIPFAGHSNITYLAISTDTLASASADSTIMLWDITTGQPLGPPLLGHRGAVNSVAFSPDGQILASAGEDTTVRLWDVATQEPIGTPLDSWRDGHQREVNSVAFSPDGKLLASGSDDSNIILWDFAVGRPFGSPLTDHTGEVEQVAFSADGKVLVSASADNTIIQWDVENAQPLGQPFTGHREVISGETVKRGVKAIVISPNGQLLVSGGIDKNLILWDLDFNVHQKLACKIANRNLTVVEWRRLFGDEPYQATCPEIPLAPDIAGDDGTENRDNVIQEFVVDGVIYQAGLLAQRGEIEAAIAEYEQALKLDPNLDIDPQAIARKLRAEQLVTEAEVSVNEGDDETAIVKLNQALELDSSLDFEPEAKVTALAVQNLINQGDQLVRSNEFELATKKYEQALALSPGSIELGERITQVEAQTLVENGNRLAEQGEFELATASYEQALGLNSDLNLNPAAKFLKIGQELAVRGQIEQAIAAYEQAQISDATLQISADEWNTLCRFGSLWGRASAVIRFCDQAVELNPKAGWIRDSRGLARALVGNKSGAIEDFQIVVDFLTENHLYQSRSSHREIWVDELNLDRNPFSQCDLGQLPGQTKSPAFFRCMIELIENN